MATRLNSLTPPQLEARIDRAFAAADHASRLRDWNARDRHLERARKFGSVLAEVNTVELFQIGKRKAESENADPVAEVPQYSDADALPNAASDAVRPWAKGLRKLIHAWLLNHGPSTSTEICRGLGKMPWSIRPRLSELSLAGAITPTGEHRSETGRGAPAEVWKAL